MSGSKRDKQCKLAGDYLRAGLDIREVARLTGLSIAEIIRIGKTIAG